MWKYQNTDELYHYGILGMRWGRGRKSQNNTPSSKRKKQKPMSQDAKDVKSLRKKKVSEMSNAELKKLNERMNLEQNYSRLNPSTIKKGMIIVTTTAGVMGTALSLYDNSNRIIGAGQKVAKSKIVTKGKQIVKSIIKK